MNPKIESVDVPIPETSPQPIRSLYFNGFEVGMGNSDVYVTVQTNGQKVLRLNLSYTLAKTLGKQLVALVDLLEKESGHPIMSTDEITKHMQELQKRSNR